MRALMCAAVLFVIGCGSTSQPSAESPPAKGVAPKTETAPPREKGKAKAPEKGDPEPPRDFDARDMGKACRWLASELNKARVFPDGNAVAGKAALDRYQEKLNGLAGKEITWDMDSVAILPNTDISLGSSHQQFRTSVPDRGYSLFLVPSSFPTKGESWVATAKSTDVFTLRATIVEVAMTPPLPAQVIGKAGWLPDTNSWRVKIKDASVKPVR